MKNNQENNSPEVEAYLDTILVAYKTTVLQSLTEQEREAMKHVLLRDTLDCDHCNACDDCSLCKPNPDVCPKCGTIFETTEYNHKQHEHWYKTNQWLCPKCLEEMN